MKKLIITFIVVFLSLSVKGQIYEIPKRASISSSLKLYCLGIYKKGADNYFYYEPYSPERIMPSTNYVSTSKGNERYFCYSKKAKRYYLHTDNIIGYYIPSDNYVEKTLLDAMKENNVKKIDLIEASHEIDNVLRQMDDNYKKKNDSIDEQKRKQREKQIQDSIAAEQKKELEMEDYRKTHNWRDLEMSRSYNIQCDFCVDKSHNQKDYRVISISSDTIYYFLDKAEYNILGIDYVGIHYSALTSSFKSDKKFIDYINTWRDSIANNSFSNQAAVVFNLIQYNEFKDKVCKAAPNGFIQNWGWNLNSADGIEPYFKYFNTSKKTIKYVDFYFSVFNAVGDKCYLKYDRSYVGKVRGVGPVEPFDAGSWNWDRATHYTSGDASEMRIIKLVVTYMDGTVKTIPRDAIVYDNY